MLAGELRHRVTIRKYVETKTPGSGGFTEVPSTLYARIPAYVEPLSGRELNLAMQIDPRVRYQVRLRYHQGVKAEQELVYHAFDGDRVLEIVGPPLMDEQDRSMVLMCSEAAS